MLKDDIKTTDNIMSLIVNTFKVFSILQQNCQHIDAISKEQSVWLFK